MAEFSKRDVHRAFRKYNDTVSDLFSSDFRTWGDNLHRLLDHCENNPVMAVVLAALKGNTHVSVASWYADAQKTRGGMIGSARYALPIDDEDRTALLYQFLLAVDRNEIDVSDFCVHFFGKTRYQEKADIVNQEIVTKFTRELAYRLEEIEEDVAGKDTVTSTDLVIFNHYDQSTVVHGNVSGGVVNVGHGTVTGSNIAINSNAELVTALNALRSEFTEKVARAACDTLVQEVQGSNDEQVIRQATQEIIESEPTKAKKLVEVLERIGTSLVSSTIFHSIRTSLGL